MGMLIEALSSIGLMVGIIWGLSLWRSGAVDRATARAEEAEARRAAELDAALARKGEPLHCLNCDNRFPGPLPDTGCPQCHLSTLVVPDTDEVNRPKQTRKRKAGS